MSTLTSGQIKKLIELFEDTPTKRVQDILISGFLADLRDSSRVPEIPRDEFRRMCGLQPLNLLLEPIGIVIVPATKKFVLRKQFAVDTSRNAQIKISHLRDSFKNWFLEKVEEPVAKATLRCAKLTSSSIDKSIRREIGPEFEETALSQIWALMGRQPNGEWGVLLTNGYKNIFYVRDAKALLRAVSVDLFGGSWCVNAYSVQDPLGWFVGRLVFSRNS